MWLAALCVFPQTFKISNRNFPNNFPVITPVARKETNKETWWKGKKRKHLKIPHC